VVDQAVRRVVVYGDSRYVDLALSAALPIAALIPRIVDILAANCHQRADPMAARYQLSLPGDVALDPAKTLEQLEILDGSTLMLTSSSTVLAPPRVDDVAEEVSASLALAARPWTRQAGRLVGALTAGCLAAAGAAILLGTAFGINDVRRGACAGVAAAAGLIALLAALAAQRAFCDEMAGLLLGLAAGGFAALAGMLAVPGEVGAPNVLLATAAAATAATVMRVIGCYATVFTALACFATVEAAAAVVAAVTAVPLSAIGAASAVISLLLIEASAPVSIVLAGLPSQVSSESDASCDELSTKAIRAKAWLSSLVAAFAASAALGAVGAAAGSPAADGPRWLGITFAAMTGGVLLLRARSQADLVRSAPLIAAGIATLSATLVTAAVVYPPYRPYLAAASMTLAAAALCLGFITQTMTLSPIGRRSVELLEYLVLAVVVPLACWICGLYSGVRGLNLL
jgi:type VII secretion integral membrane protein EccD